MSGVLDLIAQINRDIEEGDERAQRPAKRARASGLVAGDGGATSELCELRKQVRHLRLKLKELKVAHGAQAAAWERGAEVTEGSLGRARDHVVFVSGELEELKAKLKEATDKLRGVTASGTSKAQELERHARALKLKAQQNKDIAKKYHRKSQLLSHQLQAARDEKQQSESTQKQLRAEIARLQRLAPALSAEEEGRLRARLAAAEQAARGGGRGIGTVHPRRSAALSVEPCPPK